MDVDASFTLNDMTESAVYLENISEHFSMLLILVCAKWAFKTRLRM